MNSYIQYHTKCTLHFILYRYIKHKTIISLILLLYYYYIIITIHYNYYQYLFSFRFNYMFINLINNLIDQHSLCVELYEFILRTHKIQHNGVVNQVVLFIILVLIGLYSGSGSSSSSGSGG